MVVALATPVESPRLFPPPLTPTQKRIVLALAVVIGLTRFLAIAQSLFDWDEALFAGGVREFNVQAHHPHPPGYPIFIAAAKFFHLFGIDEFRSLQIVVVLGALFLFPALFCLAREIGFDFSTAACGATVFAFFPNVWIYGGTGFSDVPSTTVAFFACALLLRGRYDTRAYLMGAVVLGIAAGMRTPSLLLGFVPAILATFHQLRARRFGVVLGAVVAGAAVVCVCYAGAALASHSVDSYIHSVKWQRQYVRDVDSWHNPGRGPLTEAAKRFLLRPVGTKDALHVLAVVSAVSVLAALLRRRIAPLLTLGIFAPLAVTAWFNFDLHTPARYAIGYMAAHALLGMDGFLVLGRRRAVQIFFCATAVLYFARFTWPALDVQRNSDAPPIAAIQWVRRNAPPGSPVYVNGTYDPHARFYLHDYDFRLFDEPAQIPPDVDAWVIDDDVRQNAHNFVRRKKNLWGIVRQRAFEASVVHSSTLIRYGAGWYSEEGSGFETFRWMPLESHTVLPVIRGTGRLVVRLYVPLDALPVPPVIEIRLNGKVLDRFPGAVANVERAYVVPSRTDAPNELVIATSAGVRPSDIRDSQDTRLLGLRIDELTWTPVR